MHDQVSHSTRVRGLKSFARVVNGGPNVVALYTSAWIEINDNYNIYLTVNVALYTSAWIEIEQAHAQKVRVGKSHSTRVRGLKSSQVPELKRIQSRTLHECVD